MGRRAQRLRHDPNHARYRRRRTSWRFRSRVNGIGPLVTYTLGDPKDPLTFIAKYYKEFDAENTFEGESFHIAVTAKF